ncbi:MAG: glucose-6-phosphate isomerase, partial [Chlorobi bacterium]|nr:glucose-6-phosphate isomerase [Chlorobiota bacterium]
MSALINSETWKHLVIHKNKLDKTDMKTMFASDPERFPRFTVKQKGMLFDYSKNIINDETMRLLFKLAEDCCVKEKISGMFSGQKINITENRAVLHTALRNLRSSTITVDSNDIMPGINDVLSRMGRFAES